MLLRKVLGEALDHGDEEGSNLAGANADHGEYIVAGEDERRCLPLDVRGTLYHPSIDSFKGVRAQTQLQL